MEQAKALQPFKTEYTTNEIRSKLTGDSELDDELADLPIYERDNILGQSFSKYTLSRWRVSTKRKECRKKESIKNFYNVL